MAGNEGKHKMTHLTHYLKAHHIEIVEATETTIWVRTPMSFEEDMTEEIKATWESVRAYLGY